jgi:TonB family protein
MGVVYRATDPVLGRTVAVKCIQVHPGLAEGEVSELRQRFENEARSAATLSHPSVVTVFDAGADDHTLYIAMELVLGEALDDVLASGRVLSYKEIADLALQLAGGLDHAHRKGIVHRDIKPANVLINRRGQPKITDFGVARQAASTLTATGTIIGTPAYMSPEQITGHQVTGASDQFSLAIVFYEMLTGRRPFVGEGATTILYKIVHEEPEAPHSVRGALPGGLDAVMLRALNKDPGARFDSCTEFAEALRQVLGAAPAGPAVTLTAKPAAGKADAEAPTQLMAAPESAALPSSLPDSASGSGSASLPQPRILGLAAAGLVISALALWWLAGGGATVDGDAAGDVAPPTPAAGLGAAATRQSAASVAEAAIILRVTTRPAGAAITLDGDRIAELSPTDIQVLPGVRHTLLLERAGSRPVSWAFDPRDLADEQRTGGLFFPLEPERAAAADGPAPSAEPGAEEGNRPEPVRIRGDVLAPEILDRTVPKFPDWAAAEKLPRYVVLELVIDRTGVVRETRVLRAVHPDLEAIAIEAVRTWEFSPGTRDGEPVDVFFNVSVQFQPAEGGGRR